MFPIALSSENIRIRFAVTHEEELHQVQLLAEAIPIDPLPGTKLLAGKHLNGKTATFEFPITELTATPNDPVSLQLTDIHGNTSWTWFPNPIDGTVQLDRNGDGVLNILDFGDGCVPFRTDRGTKRCRYQCGWDCQYIRPCYTC